VFSFAIYFSAPLIIRVWHVLKSVSRSLDETYSDLSKVSITKTALQVLDPGPLVIAKIVGHAGQYIYNKKSQIIRTVVVS